jgi:serine/threonine protein kinase
MGSVWLARHTSLDITCAVKFISGDAAEIPEVRARFEREAKAAAQLKSPNVVQILDHGVWEGLPYIAMELLEGEDLAHRLHRRIKLEPAETVAIVSQVARALGKAHAAGLVHRDLKPGNIFLVRDEDREIVKVLDFGIAKVSPSHASYGTPDNRTKTGAIMGTPHYMSPEQAQDAKNVDHRTDLWALGVIAFECLTGTLPFNANALGELFVRIIVRPIPVPSQVAPVPHGFDAWWFRAMERDPNARFQSARELAEALAISLGVTQKPEDSFASSSRAMMASAPTLPASGRASASALTAGPVVTAIAPTQPRSRAPMIAVGAVLGIATVGGLAAFLATRRGPEVDPTATAAAALPATAAASASASAAPSVTVAPSPTEPTAASAEPTAAPTTSATVPKAKSKTAPLKPIAPRPTKVHDDGI